MLQGSMQVFTFFQCGWIRVWKVWVGDGAVILINANLVDNCWCKELWVRLGVFRFQFHESSWELMSRTCGPIYTGTNVQISWRPLALFSVIRGRRRRRRLLEHCLRFFSITLIWLHSEDWSAQALGVLTATMQWTRCHEDFSMRYGELSHG